jgi:hypothetical protein
LLNFVLDKPYDERLQKSSLFNYEAANENPSKLSRISMKWQKHTYGLDLSFISSEREQNNGQKEKNI